MSSSISGKIRGKSNRIKVLEVSAASSHLILSVMVFHDEHGNRRLIHDYVYTDNSRYFEDIVHMVITVNNGLYKSTEERLFVPPYVTSL
jgi:hypothetical protein